MQDLNGNPFRYGSTYSAPTDQWQGATMGSWIGAYTSDGSGIFTQSTSRPAFNWLYSIYDSKWNSPMQTTVTFS